MSAPKFVLTLLLCTLLSGCKNIINPNTPIAATVQTDNNLTGTFHIDNPCFGNGQTPIPLTGSVTSSNKFSLTSPSVNGETLTLTGTFSGSGTSFTQGYLGIAGPCTGNLISQTGDQSGSIVNPVGTQIPNLSGDWNYFPGFRSLNLSEQLNQSSTPDADGRFALSGNATIIGSPCFTSGTLQPGSYISGTQGHEIILLNDGSTFTSPVTLYLTSTTSTARPLDLQLYPGYVTGGNCSGSYNVDLQ
jgi:hypothetical protein